uniref:Secreted protein n=1 Tax=Steinernema glaseri TaxID=37863 RepID=A0A1I7YIN4_9BILA
MSIALMYFVTVALSGPVLAKDRLLNRGIRSIRSLLLYHFLQCRTALRDSKSCGIILMLKAMAANKGQ